MARGWLIKICAFIVALDLFCATASIHRAKSVHKSVATPAASSPERFLADSRYPSSAVDGVGTSPTSSFQSNIILSTDQRAAPVSQTEASLDPEEDVLQARAGFTSVVDDDGTRPSDHAGERDFDNSMNGLYFSSRRMSPAEEASEAFLGKANSRVERGLFYSCFKKYFSYSCSCGKGTKTIIAPFISVIKCRFISYSYIALRVV